MYIILDKENISVLFHLVSEGDRIAQLILEKIVLTDVQEVSVSQTLYKTIYIFLDV